MANIDEIALGIASVLVASDKPEPMPVELHGQNDFEAVRLVKRVIEECADADRPLFAARVSRRLLPFFKQNLEGGQPIYHGMVLLRTVGLTSRVEFFRYDPD